MKLLLSAILIYIKGEISLESDYQLTDIIIRFRRDLKLYQCTYLLTIIGLSFALWSEAILLSITLSLLSVIYTSILFTLWATSREVPSFVLVEMVKLNDGTVRTIKEEAIEFIRLERSRERSENGFFSNRARVLFKTGVIEEHPFIVAKVGEVTIHPIAGH